ncbi:MAG: Asp-tRNA(Asn)/Glu-tRNA(Gln) amidotransferase subunit GatC [Neisseriaceae bacterium]|nr:Asp-tRNA(Asn)/Glu-tRNA(Gln) amidotransferase subunit GatC [Neisseriaceae bacterium]
MALTLADVDKIARLSRLFLSDEEKQVTLTQLNNIFDLIAKMQSVNTEDVEPLSHPHEYTQRLREDVVTEANRRDEYQAVAPQLGEHLYLVPKVIE